MGRVLCLDYGERRIGVAISDPSRTIASPLTTLVRRRGKRPPWPELAAIVSEREVEEVVVGLPLEMDGSEGDWAEEVRRFGGEVARRTGLPVRWVDERLSSVEAERAVRESGLPRRKREEKARIDASAAALILRSFLEGSGIHE
jgi:putative holliday junction resolvase